MAALSDSQLASVVKQAGFPASSWPTAIAIILAESGGNPNATHKNLNGSTDYGLFQINSVHGSLLQQGSWSDPVANARMGLAVSSNGSNWKPWTTFNTGAYRLFLPRASNASGSPVTPISPDIQQVSSPVASTFGAIFDPHSYYRIGMFLFGTLLVLMSVESATGIVGKVSSKVGNAVKVAAIL